MQCVGSESAALTIELHPPMMESGSAYCMHASLGGRTSTSFNTSNAEATFFRKHKDAKIFEKHLKTVMLVFIS